MGSHYRDRTKTCHGASVLWGSSDKWDPMQRGLCREGGSARESQICAGGQKGKDSCVGDSGSGLMRSRRDSSRGGAGRSELIGVVSFGPRLCGTEGVPGVYSRVESFLTWILDTVENN